VEAGISPNARDPSGGTPLHTAAELNDLDLARFLLSHGANASARDDQRRTPLQVAEQQGNTRVARLLRDYQTEK